MCYVSRSLQYICVASYWALHLLSLPSVKAVTSILNIMATFFSFLLLKDYAFLGDSIDSRQIELAKVNQHES